MVKIEHNDITIKTVGALISEELSVVVNISVQEFLNVESNGRINEERIREMWSEEEQEDMEGVPPSEYLLKQGTPYFIPEDKVNMEAIAADSFEVVSTDTKAFFSRKLINLINDGRYEKIFSSSEISQDITRVEHPKFTVWMWCKALHENEVDDGFVDLTPFVSHLEKNDDLSSNFTLELPPILGERKDGKWKARSVYDYNDNFYATANINKVEKGEFKREIFLFEHVVSANDLIFIRFETLENEDRKRQDISFKVSNKDIPGNIYDMIGLVDDVVPTYSQSEQTRFVIRVSGRDLTKALEDDGSYFFPIEYAAGNFYKAQGGRENNSLLQRLITGELMSLAAYMYRDIAFSLKFILNQFSNIRVVPDEVFKSYGDRRNEAYEIDGEQNGEVRGIWQIMKLVVDENVMNRRIADQSIATEQGSILNFIYKVCQEPFVEFFTDTYGDMFYLIARKPPHDEQGIKSSIKNDFLTDKDENNPDKGNDFTVLEQGSMVIDVYNHSVIQDSLSYDYDNTFSWYKFEPRALFMGTNQETTLAVIPAIFFQRYADLWGNKVYSEVSNYMPYPPGKRKVDLQYIYEQSFRDLKYMIDSTAYLPFTRKGNIVLKGGDRRIKKGMFIRYHPTNEIFKVDSTQNSASVDVTQGSVDRETVIQVSRGMVEKYIWGREVDGVNMSYFNIVNTDLDFGSLEGTSEIGEEQERQKFLYENVISDFSVNEEVFDFFLKRKQHVV